MVRSVWRHDEATHLCMRNEYWISERDSRMDAMRIRCFVDKCGVDVTADDPSAHGRIRALRDIK